MSGWFTIVYTVPQTSDKQSVKSSVRRWHHQGFDPPEGTIPRTPTLQDGLPFLSIKVLMLKKFMSITRPRGQAQYCHFPGGFFGMSHEDASQRSHHNELGHSSKYRVVASWWEWRLFLFSSFLGDCYNLFQWYLNLKSMTVIKRRVSTFL